MRRELALRLIAGCAVVLALELPSAWRAIREDLRGPYASGSALTAGSLEPTASDPEGPGHRLAQGPARPSGAGSGGGTAPPGRSAPSDLIAASDGIVD